MESSCLGGAPGTPCFALQASFGSFDGHPFDHTSSVVRSEPGDAEADRTQQQPSTLEWEQPGVNLRSPAAAATRSRRAGP